MVLKETYNYASKQKIRQELREFIEKNYSKQGQRKSLKILTLMGHEEHELTEIWDSLEIPRQNISVIERNPEIYELIKNKNLGIKLINNSLEDYVLKSNDKFNIINLDFQGYFNDEKDDAIRRIVYNQILEDRGILATWFFGKREKEDTKNLFIKSQNNFYLSLQEQSKKYNKEIDFSSEDFGNLELNKSGIITNKILISFLIGKTNFKTHPLIDGLNLHEEYHDYIRKKEDFDKWLQSLIGFPKEFLDNRIFQRRPEFKASIHVAKNLKENDKISKEQEKTIFEPWATAYSREFIVNKLEKEIEEQIVPQQNPLKVLEMLSRCALKTRNRNAAEILSLQGIESKVCTDIKRFYYISDDNSPFYVDMFLFKSTDYFSNFLWNYNVNNEKITINPVREDGWKIKKKFKQYKNALNKTAGDIPLRIYIDKQGEIVKQKEEHYQNIWSTIEKAVESNSNYNLPEKITIQLPKKQIAENQNKILSKEEATYLLKEGFTPKEIIDVYPREYTLHQLEAFRY